MNNEMNKPTPAHIINKNIFGVNWTHRCIVEDLFFFEEG
jgi:hypothetical protein